jgi:phosphate transport system substrate-binding protein
MNKAVMTALMLIVAALPTTSYARDQLMIVGSSTVFPYTQAVAEQYTQMSGNPAPVVESTGTGGGFKVFCGGIGLNFADITGASRAIKDSEVELCNQNGVTDVKEVLIGYDGLSIASAIGGIEIELTKQHIFQALASEVVVDGAIVANPYKMWNEIDASLPELPITVFGPPPTSGTRDAFVELVMHEGCAAFPEIEALADDRKKEVCDRMRQDGPFIEAGENDNLIVQRLLADTNTLGIFGYSFLYENTDTLKGISVDGVFPTPETIADASYSVSRPLYIYIKNAHLNIIPGMNEFVEEYLSDAAIGPAGYLLERGLIPITN